MPTSEKLRNKVAELLTSMNIHTPPILPYEIARHLGYGVICEDLPENSRGYFNVQTNTIVVNAHDRRERQNFTIAHELGERLKPDDLAPIKAERWANEFAAELLLPSELFESVGKSCDWDLMDLKETFSTTSWEVIARRILKFHECLVTIIDEGQVYFRRACPGVKYPRQLMPEELQAIETSGPVSNESMQVRIWNVVEDVKRAILIAEAFG